jgi:diguanylate cyclase (GGDEF)-like protein
VSDGILKHIRPLDFAARYGGDEFVVLLPNVGMAEAVEVAERVRVGVSEEAWDPPVTVSIGLASFTGDRRLTGITVDRALYEAKAGGRNRVAAARG